MIDYSTLTVEEMIGKGVRIQLALPNYLAIKLNISLLQCIKYFALHIQYIGNVWMWLK